MVVLNVCYTGVGINFVRNYVTLVFISPASAACYIFVFVSCPCSLCFEIVYSYMSVLGQTVPHQLMAGI